MSTLFWLGLLWLAWRLLRPSRSRRFSRRKHWALALGQPMAATTEMTGFSGPEFDHMGEPANSLFRAPMLHQMGLPPDTTDEAARRHLADVFEARWLSTDLDTPQPGDDPRAAIAFACVRMAFFARCAMLMKWLEPDAAWRVLLLNAQRAQDCFTGWEDFGRAYLAGRRQWVARFRADALGKGFDDAALRRLLAKKGPWHKLEWPGLPAFHPRKASRFFRRAAGAN